MKRLLYSVLGLVLLVGLLFGCGGSGSGADEQATQVAAGIAATLTAQVPPPTVVVTPVPQEEPAGGTQITEVRLAADGSGDFPGLTEALAAAAGGATITLEPGIYQIGEALTVSKAVSLVGAGQDKTEIVSRAAGHVLRFEGDGRFSAEGITFRHEGPELADVVVVAGGEVDFSRCRFTGGRHTADGGQAGSGLLLTGAATGQVSDCEATANDLQGFSVEGSARPLLESNTSRDNGQCGLAYFQQAAGEARANDFSRNSIFGIYVDSVGQPTLVGNRCDSNGDSGISYWGSTSGTARENTCADNAAYGIYVADDAQPALEGNRVTGSGEAGIGYFGQSAGAARGNECSGNDYHGIIIEEQAHPELVDNRCIDNGDTGIAFFGDSSGLARANQCSGNKAAGIHVSETAHPTLEDNDCGSDGAVAVPGGAEGRIAFVSYRDGNSEIYVMNGDGTDQLRLTTYGAQDYAPAWSPDGARIAFVSERDGNAEVYVMNYDGSDQTRLTQNWGQDLNPGWSPDGSRIIYSAEGGGYFAVHVMNPDGTGKTALTSLTGQNGSPSWSPNGSRIAMVGYPERRPEIFVMNPDGGGQTNITNHPSNHTSPAWSPDGSRIAIASNRQQDGTAGDYDVWLMNPDGSNLTQLTDDPTEEKHPAWSPDGTRIVFDSDRLESFTTGILVMNSDGSMVTLLTDDSSSNADPSWGMPPAFGAAEVATGLLGPRYNPDGDPQCFDQPDRAIDREWLISAENHQVVLYESIEITLWNKWGRDSEIYQVRAEVIAPDETRSVASAVMTGTEEAAFTYPDDFAGANTALRGTYTIIWTADGGFVACDGFVAIGGASWLDSDRRFGRATSLASH